MIWNQAGKKWRDDHDARPPRSMAGPVGTKRYVNAASLFSMCDDMTCKKCGHHRCSCQPPRCEPKLRDEDRQLDAQEVYDLGPHCIDHFSLEVLASEHERMMRLCLRDSRLVGDRVETKCLSFGDVHTRMVIVAWNTLVDRADREYRVQQRQLRDMMGRYSTATGRLPPKKSNSFAKPPPDDKW